MYINILKFNVQLLNVKFKFKFIFSGYVVLQFFVLSCLKHQLIACDVHLTENRQKQNKSFEILFYWWRRRSHQLHFVSIKQVLYFVLIL